MSYSQVHVFYMQYNMWHPNNDLIKNEKNIRYDELVNSVNLNLLCTGCVFRSLDDLKCARACGMHIK